eukprot:TRINITY_DN14793_c0_g1_i1.p1 TRINITY_DN14793_c0_g1~~TRINITY_DN14793_c0_g1_i1.p1  ORF type:complete len:390 (+),score=25.83 TRINITY_DN14793_c0_g1_i1:559-1728(+)
MLTVGSSAPKQSYLSNFSPRNGISGLGFSYVNRNSDSRLRSQRQSGSVSRSFRVSCSSSVSDLTLTTDARQGTVTRNLEIPLRTGGLAPDGLSYLEKFVVRCYEVGANRTATIETVANLMQESGCNHARSVGFSTDGFSTTPTMRKKHLIWVTARMHIEVYQYPLWGDLVEIETWCQAEGKLATRRDWLLRNVTTNTLIGRATSTWVMMNQDTRRLARVTDDVRDEYIIFFPKDPRLVFPQNDISSSKKKIYKLEDPAQYKISGLMPRRADLDMNEHVNNVTYIGWLLESVPPEILETHELQTITLDYRRECNKGDIVESLTSLEFKEAEALDIENNLASSENGVPSATCSEKSLLGKDGIEFVHLIRLADSGSEINRGRSEWRRKIHR